MRSPFRTFLLVGLFVWIVFLTMIMLILVHTVNRKQFDPSKIPTKHRKSIFDTGNSARRDTFVETKEQKVPVMKTEKKIVKDSCHLDTLTKIDQEILVSKDTLIEKN